MPIFNKRIKVRSGGTYFRVFPVSIILKCLIKSYEMGHTPLIYLHPYELNNKKEFWTSWKDLNFLPIRKRIYWWIRQNQWYNFGNRNTIRKLEEICLVFEHQGVMKDLINKS